MRLFSAAAVFLTVPLLAQTEPPKTWVDPDTGHRVIRLTDEPGSATLYFNQNWFTPDNRKLVYSSRTGIYTMDLATRETKRVVETGARLVEVGHKTASVYYTRAGSIFTTNTETGVTREIAKLPPRGSVATVNADETLVAGTYTEADGPANNNYASPEQRAQQQPLEQPPNKGQMMEERLAAHIPMGLFVIDIKSGELTTIHRSTDWLNHLLFSPTDPTLLMFCHEGPWHKVDRIWTIRTDGSQITKIHSRTMAMEIFGHEFWSLDGATIYYDLQTPRGEDFWLAAYKLTTGERTWYHLQRNEWSIHFNVSVDGQLFCGDGGDSGQVAKAPDGEWIYLFRPQLIRNQGVEDKRLVSPGVLHAEKLVNMSKHKYTLEPNVRFSPDAKWVMFRSNMFGATYVFAVEVEKARGADGK
jgi:oligogalacturonide lyase